MTKLKSQIGLSCKFKLIVHIVYLNDCILVYHLILIENTF